MAKYQVLMQYSDGTEERDDEIFDTEEDAKEYGCYLVSCNRTGAETLNMSNMGDYPLDDYEDPDFEIVEVDDQQFLFSNIIQFGWWQAEEACHFFVRQNTKSPKKYPKTYRRQEISTKGSDFISTDDMKNVDARTVDRDSLVDVTQIKIDDSPPLKERAEEFQRQIKNPYYFRVGKAVIKNGYRDAELSLQKRFVQFARTL